MEHDILKKNINRFPGHFISLHLMRAMYVAEENICGRILVIEDGHRISLF